ncbi:MAG: helix-turn-helix transcriptional regulator [Bacteroidota bacterium]
MRFSILLFFLLCYASSLSQFQFNGQVSELYRSQPVYLSLVEDYRKTGRVYLDQIIQKTQADSLGYFIFSGEQLPLENRFYRIHTDGCDEQQANKLHFMGQCPTTMSILFIANNEDNISFPLGNYDQEFCEITSTNTAAAHLLQFEGLKEKMVLDFVEEEGSPLAENLKFNKWFETFHEFAQSTEEPLVELFVYSFLSERSNETYSAYKAYVKEHKTVPALAYSLSKKYPNAPYTSQFFEETVKHQDLAAQGTIQNRTFWMKDVIPVLSIALLVVVVLVYFRPTFKFSKRNYLGTLTTQEQKVANAIKQGKTNKEIAAELFISLSTVKTHINSIYKKLDVGSRKELLSKI